MTAQRKPTSQQWTRRPGLIHLAVILAYTLLTIVMTWPVARHAATAIPGDGFDGWQNYWNLWWLKTALVERITNPFVTDVLHAPTGVGLYFHTLNPLNGLMSMPVQLAAGLIPAYNVVVLISWVLSGCGAFLLCLWLLRPGPDLARRVNGAGLEPASARYLGAFLAGAVYAFAPFHMAHLLGHMQVMSLQWIPFYILYLLRGMTFAASSDRFAASSDRFGAHGASFATRGRPWLRDGLLAGLFLVFSGLSDWYFVLYLLLFTGLAVVAFWLAGLARRRAVARVSAGVILRSLATVVATPLVAAVFFTLVLSPVLLPMVREATQFDFMVKPARELYVFSASMADYLIPSRLHAAMREAGPLLPGNQIAPVSERTIAAGYVVAALALAAVALQRRRSAFWLLAAFFFLLLSLGPTMHLGNITWQVVPEAPDEAVSWTLFGVLNRLVPFMRISRSVSRYALMVELSLAMLAGIGLSALLQRMGRTAALVTVTGVLALVLFEFWVAPYPVSEPDTPAFYADLAQSGGAGTMLNLPMNYDRPGYLLYQTVHGRPLAVAYISRDDPRTLTERVPLLQHFRHLGPDIVSGDPAQVGMTVLDDLGVEYVALDRYKMPGGEERVYTEALADALFAGQEPLYEDDRLTVYRTAPVDEAAPYVELGPLNWGPLRVDGQDAAGVDSLSRAVGDGPACAYIRHARGDTRVTLDYRTDPGAQATVAGASGDILAVLDPAPGGADVTIALSAPVNDGDAAAFCIQSAQPDSVHVRQIALLEG